MSRENVEKATRPGDTHGHAHGFVDASILRSRRGIRAVVVSLAILGLTAMAQAVVFVATNSIALLADLIHNGGDALTAVPVGIAFAMRSARAERYAGLAVVVAIFVSACVAGVEAVRRLINPEAPDHLVALATAGAIGFGGNWLASIVRRQAGRTLRSPALTADGNHARADAYVSLAVVASAAVVALGVPIADPLIGLAITLVILRITWQSWTTVRAGHGDRALEGARAAGVGGRRRSDLSDGLEQPVPGRPPYRAADVAGGRLDGRRVH
jgi:divalent metal cation (Fe/Co/Zn/Cd) transporter